MLPANSIQKYLILICLIGTSAVAIGQSNDISKAISKSGILDISELRPSDPNQIFKQIYLRDSTHSYVPQDASEDSEWILDSKEIFTYSNQGNRTITVRSKRIEGEWKNELRIVNAYDSDNKLSVRQSLSWSDSTSEWLNSTRLQYHYNFLGQESEVVTQKWIKGAWKFSERIEKIFADTDLIDTQISYIWNDLEHEWLEKERTLYAYSDSDLLDEVTFQVWNDSTSTWTNLTLSAYTYDENDQLIETEYSSWDESSDRYVANVLILVSYNEKGQVTGTNQTTLNGEVADLFVSQQAQYDEDGNLGDVLHSQWDAENEEWDVLKKLTHFWSRKFVGTLDGNDSKIDCNFANPYTIGLPWYCESLKENITYSVDVYDLMGRLYYSNTFSGGSSFTIHQQIPPGMYSVVIRGGLDQHTEKVLIRN